MHHVENCAGHLHYYYMSNDSDIIQKVPSEMLLILIRKWSRTNRIIIFMYHYSINIDNYKK